MTPLLYYPGCSLTGTAAAYDRSTRSLLAALGVDMQDLSDWTCCGATAATAVNDTLGLALPARNLALAEKQSPHSRLMAPCSACYLNLKRAEEACRTSSETVAEFNGMLASEKLVLKNHTTVIHLLALLSDDSLLDLFERAVCRPLNDLLVAPYYGCQCLRPYPVFDDPEAPTSMEALLALAGARVFPWSMGAKCCGASHMTTKPHIALELSGAILAAAKGADAVVTVCPMCHLNLSGHQKKISRLKGRDLAIPVYYLPQLLGLALGLGSKDLGLTKKEVGTYVFA